MAEVAKYIAGVQVGDSAKHLGSASVIVNTADAKAYVAAADATARAATDVGTLLTATLALQGANSTTGWRKWSVQSDFINDGFVYAAKDADLYNSNQWKVTYQTTNAGLPTIESIYIPARTAGGTMESDGIHLTLASGIGATYATALVATGLSSFLTAITAVNEITANDV